MNPRADEIVDNPDDWVAEHIREYVATDGRRGHRLSGWNGGAKRHPDWYLNLVEDPVVVQVQGDDRFAATAREASADDKPALWDLMTALSPALDDYEDESGRDIPVVLLERI